MEMNHNETEQVVYQCTSCGESLVRKKARDTQRYFWGCSNYPDCKTILPDDNGKPGEKHNTYELTQYSCPGCETGKLAKREGKYGIFYGCTNFPECKTTGNTIEDILAKHEQK